MAIHLDLPFRVPAGSEALSSQSFGITDVQAEPPGFVFPDKSVDYFTQGTDSVPHPHVHAGIDYPLDSGTPLFAPANGVVKFQGENDLLPGGGDSGFGNMIELNHGAIITLYGHLSAFDVSAGQRVRKGQQIGRVGSTGSSSGPHLHWSVIRPADSHWINPALFAITPVSFVVTADADGQPVRIFQNPSVQSRALRTASPHERLTCTAWTYAQPRLDNSTGHKDARWYRLGHGGWVASARVQGNAPHSQPLP